VISVVIPAYNEAKALPQTLGQLARQAGSFETIVADGGSTDGRWRLRAGGRACS
jgi:glycosyltransferase involved in cell wall biosynthesis